MAEKLVTKNYEIFKTHASNRPIDKGNLRKIKGSIESKNMLEFRPLIVNEKMEVIDGQHRLQAAKELDLPVYYTIDKASEIGDIILLNQNQKQWKIEDYLNYFISIGNEDYRKTNSFMIENQINLRMCIRLLFGVGSEALKAFRFGKVKYPSPDQLVIKKEILKKCESIFLILKEMKIDGGFFYSSVNFRTSLIDFIANPRVEFEVLKHKIKMDVSKVGKRQNCGDYYLMLKEIYNYKNRDEVL
jgi:hypothetical protein